MQALNSASKEPVQADHNDRNQQRETTTVQDKNGARRSHWKATIVETNPSGNQEHC